MNLCFCKDIFSFYIIYFYLFLSFYVSRNIFFVEIPFYCRQFKFLLQCKHLKCNIFKVYFYFLSQNRVFNVKCILFLFFFWKMITCIRMMMMIMYFFFFQDIFKEFIKVFPPPPFFFSILINIFKTFLIKLENCISRKLKQAFKNNGFLIIF